MTKDEAKKAVTKELRNLGFKSHGKIFARYPDEEVIQVAYVSLHRFAPVVLVDLGVLLRDRWEDPLGGQARQTPTAWDLWIRLDKLFLSTDSTVTANDALLSEALNLEGTCEDSVRKSRFGELLSAANGMFFERFKTKASIEKYAECDGTGIMVNWKLLEYLNLPKR